MNETSVLGIFQCRPSHQFQTGIESFCGVILILHRYSAVWLTGVSFETIWLAMSLGESIRPYFGLVHKSFLILSIFVLYSIAIWDTIFYCPIKIFCKPQWSLSLSLDFIFIFCFISRSIRFLFFFFHFPFLFYFLLRFPCFTSPLLFQDNNFIKKYHYHTYDWVYK